MESAEDLLSLPKDEPLRAGDPANMRNLDGGGKELAELSLRVDAESRSPTELVAVLGLDGTLRNDVRESLSDNLPYSPNFRGGGIKDLAGEARLLLALLLRESPPSDFFRGGKS